MAEMPAEVLQFDEILAEVLQLDDAGQYQEIINHLLRQSTDRMTLLTGLTHLLANQRFAAASYMSSAMARIWSDHPLIYFARAIGGLIANDREVEIESTASLAQLCDALRPDQRSSFYTAILDPTIRHVVAPALRCDDHVTLMRGLEILKAGAPELRQIFDWSTSTQPLRASSGK